MKRLFFAAGVLSVLLHLAMAAQSELSQRFRETHSLVVGDKGEDRFQLSLPKSRCPDAREFDHAEIHFLKKRFADAVIIRSPEPGCLRCGPVVVRWYNEPTGVLDYELRIYTRHNPSECS